MLSTDEVLDAVRQASEAAHVLGAAEVTSYHVLLGLAAVPGAAQHALEDLGLPARVLQGAGDAVYPGGVAAEERVAMAPEVKDVLADAARRAYAEGRHVATTGDVLLAIAARTDSPGRRVLAAARASAPDALADAVGEHRRLGCCAESGPNNLPDVLAEASTTPRRLPGLGSFVRELVAVVLAYAAVVAVVIALGPDGADAETVLAFMVVGLAVAVLLSVIRSLRQRWRRWLESSGAEMVAVPEGLRTMLAGYGLRRVEVHLHLGPAVDRTFTSVRRARLFICQASARDRSTLPFVLWRELAHAARRDSIRSWIAGNLAYAVFIGTVLTFDPSMVIAGFIGGVLVLVGHGWWAEIACDRVAMAYAGRPAMHAWAKRTRRAQLQWPWRRRVVLLLMYPPMAWRLAWRGR